MSKPSCQYGRICFRQNASHFEMYAHEHLDKIVIETTPTSIDYYELPDDLLLCKEIILEQVRIVRTLANRTSTASNPNITTLTPEAVTDQKPNIRNLQQSILNTNVPSCSTAVKQEPVYINPELVNVKPEPLSAQEVIQSNSTNLAPPNAIRMSTFTNVKEKIDDSAPYNYFLTAIESSPQSKSEALTITFQEIFDQSLGDLECSVQINFTVDPNWLFAQYNSVGHLDKPLLILYGLSTSGIDGNLIGLPHVKSHLIRMKNGFGSHHTKMMLLGYKDQSMRIIVSTANLYEADWHNHTQGMWISDKLDPLSNLMDYGDTDSETKFRADLMSYLYSYKIADLQPWISRIRVTDFSSINVFLITSVPGLHNGSSYGLARVSSLLSEHSAKIDRTSTIVAQCSTMGNMQNWLTEDFIRSFRCHSKMNVEADPQLKLIYPTFENVLSSYDGLMGACSLLYGNELHEKQLWLMKHLYQWRADCRFRTKAMPHIKTYARWSGKKLHWFILGSANLSKSAWGSYHRNNNNQLRLNNYEAGVMFIPKFVTKTNYFSIDESDETTPMFPQLYDIPLTKYDEYDIPFVKEFLHGA